MIFSGGPSSVFSGMGPAFHQEWLNVDLPILGLCYGHQLIAQTLGGRVVNQGKGEFGKAQLIHKKNSSLWKSIEFPTQIWMSHGDSVSIIPPEFEVIGSTQECPVAAMQHQTKPIYTLQFHPEVRDSFAGTQILKNFTDLCQPLAPWSMDRFLENSITTLKNQIGSRSVLMFLSGGVDSSVAFALLHRVLGSDRVLGIFIDHGFGRKNEAQWVKEQYTALGYFTVQYWDASERFLTAIVGKTDPQEKRKIIGATFIHFKDQVLRDLKLDPQNWLLGQGTLYPDVIESGGSTHAEVIKSHHNCVEEVQDLIRRGQIVEPLRDLYKDEVRQLGERLGLPSQIVWRHPFPGPGLSINVLCHLGSLDVPAHPQEAAIQFFTKERNYESAILPVQSVGVQGDQRTYTNPVLLSGGADWTRLETVSVEITNYFSGINRVAYLLSHEEIPSFQLHEGTCTQKRLDLLREADFCATQILIQHDLMKEIFQLLVILLPMGTSETGETVVLRPVCSEDVMTAQFAKLDWKVVRLIADQISQIPGIDAVLYDVTHKPPATFGWE